MSIFASKQEGKKDEQREKLHECLTGQEVTTSWYFLLVFLGTLLPGSANVGLTLEGEKGEKIL